MKKLILSWGVWLDLVPVTDTERTSIHCPVRTNGIED
jgi:hypothetical protein